MKRFSFTMVAALIWVVATVAFIAGWTSVVVVWYLLLIAILADEANTKYRWIAKLKARWLERKKRKDLSTFMTERHKSGVDKITKVR